MTGLGKGPRGRGRERGRRQSWTPSGDSEDWQAARGTGRGVGWGAVTGIKWDFQASRVDVVM